MELGLKDRVAIVTGGNRGIGYAITAELLREGAHVVVASLDPARNAQAIATLQGKSNGRVIGIPTDLNDDAAVDALFKTTHAEFGRLDVLVNNAGIVRDRMIANTSEEEFDAVIAVHLKGHFATSRHAASYWRGLVKDGTATAESINARIINTSSGAGLQGSVGQGNYSAAKAGIAALTLVAAAEMGRYGVTVNAIAPSARTRMTQTVFADMMAKPDNGFDAMAPENISPLVVWLGSVESADVTGRVFEVEGGIIRAAEGWQHGTEVDKGSRWEPGELGPVVRSLLAEGRPPVPVYGA